MYHDWLFAYFKQTAKDQARLKNLGQITSSIESIKSAFSSELAREIEGLRHFNSLSTIAAEKRLAAHQVAYRFTARATQEISTEEKRVALSREIREWYESTCLYLSSDARDAIHDCWNDLLEYGSLDFNRTSQWAKIIPFYS